MKQYAVIFCNVGLDGYAGLNAQGPYPNRAVFDTHQEAKAHADSRAVAGCVFTVVEVEV